MSERQTYKNYIEGILNDNQRKNSQKENQAKVQKMIPGLKRELDTLIAANLTPGEIKIRQNTNPEKIVKIAQVNNYRWLQEQRGAMYTELTAIIPSQDGEPIEEVTIRASAYPSPHSSENIKYKISKKDSLTELLLENGKATVQSKHLIYPPDRDRRVSTGVPESSIQATPQDIQKYLDMIKRLRRKDITTKGSTPPQITKSRLGKKS